MKRWLTLCFGFLLFLLVVIYITVSWIGAGWLLAPPRKSHPAWQLEMLRHPEKFGLRIERSVSRAGVPYLLCSPNAAAGPGQRGRKLRTQLASRISPFGEIQGTVVLLHGWTMRKEGLLAVAERFCAAGLRCVIPDLPGHGENPASTTGFGAREGENHLVAEVLDSAAKQFEIPPRPALLWGLSMGGAYALQAGAAEPGRWDALVIVSSFDELEPVVRGQMDATGRGLATALASGLAIAVRWRSGFWLGDARPVEYARRLRIPALIVHGTSDTFIPMAGGRRIFDSIPTSAKRWLTVRDALHGNVLGTPQPVFAEMSGWFLTWLAPTDPKRTTTSVKHSP